MPDDAHHTMIRRHSPASAFPQDNAAPPGAGGHAAWGWSLAIFAVLVLGGAGWGQPYGRLGGQLVACGMLAAALSRPCLSRPGPGWKGMDGIVAALLALFALHLVPLPPQVWTALPGRDLAMRIDTAVFGAPHWRPLSLDPEATLRALLALLPAGATWLALRRGGQARLRAILRGVVLAMLAALLLGLAQLTPAGSDWLRFYPVAHYPQPIGFFTNHNHQASFLLCALPLAGCWLLPTAGGPRIGRADWAMLALALVSAVAVLVTGSRAGAALLLPALLATVIAWAGGRGWTAARSEGRGRAGPRMVRPFLVIAALGLAAAALLALFGGEALSSALRRGPLADDQRFDYWPDVLAAAGAFWPAGSGLGTFFDAFEMHEPLSSVSALLLNHAHNDYMEIALEAGLPGLLLTGAMLAWFLRAAWRAWFAGSGPASRPALAANRAAGRMASVAIAVPMLHSLTDYPLRTFSVSCLFGLATAILAYFADGRRIADDDGPDGEFAG